ncbi:serine/threonine protein kinase [Pirellulaceae bacterium SH501]
MNKTNERDGDTNSAQEYRHYEDECLSFDCTTGWFGSQEREAIANNAANFEIRIDRKQFVLRSCLGLGGAGTVWRAEQIVPVSRVVAIKFIHASRYSSSVIERFAFEQQALAMMNHPYIAKIYDGDVSHVASPCIVMEYVDGAPISDFCDRSRFSIAERIRLFLKVCSAVEHAHQKGIIHRDLKSSNVLVTIEDSTPVPKVIDFGVSKALSWAECNDLSCETIPGAIFGTPAFMSPEQLSGETEVDARTDVYSLGVMLYELVTGTLPFDLKSVKKYDWGAVLQTVLNEDAQLPSKQLLSATELDKIATERSVSEIELCRTVRGDLDSILVKAMEKKPADRYQNIEALRDDLERFLGHFPVAARPVTLQYRLRKFYSRHHSIVMSVSIVTLALVATFLALFNSMNRVDIAKKTAVEASRIAEKERMKNLRAIETLTDLIERDELTDCWEHCFLLEQVIALHDISTDHSLSLPAHQNRGAKNETRKTQEAYLSDVLRVLTHLQSEKPSIRLNELEGKVRKRLNDLYGQSSVDSRTHNSYVP